MRQAYALLGLSFLVVFLGAYILLEEASDSQDKTVLNPPAVITNKTDTNMQLTSKAFSEGSVIPREFTCDGANTPPPLEVNGLPEGTESLVLVMDDSDLPPAIKESLGKDKFDHWAVYNLPAQEGLLELSSGQEALNSRGTTEYRGPCPPPEYEPTTHHYVFRAYALGKTLEFSTPPSLDDLEEMAKSNALAIAVLTGVYDRSHQ